MLNSVIRTFEFDIDHFEIHDEPIMDFSACK